MARLHNLPVCIYDVLKSAVAGDLIEIGVWRGDATGFMRAILKTRGVTDRLGGYTLIDDLAEYAGSHCL